MMGRWMDGQMNKRADKLINKPLLFQQFEE
jgi:hypothetical protein